MMTEDDLQIYHDPKAAPWELRSVIDSLDRQNIKPAVIREDEPPWYLQLAAAAILGGFFAWVLVEWAVQ